MYTCIYNNMSVYYLYTHVYTYVYIYELFGAILAQDSICDICSNVNYLARCAERYQSLINHHTSSLQVTQPMIKYRYINPAW